MTTNRNTTVVRRALLATGLALTLGSLSWAACSGLVSKPKPVQFSHEVHVEGEGLECASCHGAIAESEDMRGVATVDMSGCGDCHEDGISLVGAAGAPGGATPVIAPRFSHAAHLAMDPFDGKCGGCHQFAENGEQVATDRHRQCMECHREEFRDTSCEACHADFTRHAVVPADYFSHQGDFQKRHGAIAKGNEAVCDHCHRESQCATCHSQHVELVPSRRDPAGVQRDYVHRAGFLSRHAMEARAEPGACMRCHSQQTCSDCHARRGMVSGGGRSPHPAGWMTTGAKDFHGKDARRDVVACASCHDQGAASNCVGCHKVGGVGGNPHPAGWDDHRSKGDRACAPCHR